MSLFSALKRALGGTRIDLEQRFKFNPKRWVLGNNGKFNDVIDKETSSSYLIKLIDEEKSKKYRDKFQKKDYPSEAELSSSFVHENIFQPVETGQTKQGQDFLLYEADGWTRLDLLIGQRDKGVRKHAYSLIHQLAQALLAIHQSEFVHRDVCPRNIYIDADFKNLRLLEFGYTVPNKPEFTKCKNRTGTPLYMAPEIVRMKDANHAVDIFAFGITIYQLLTLRHPWGVEENSSKSTLQFDARPAEDIRSYLPNFKEPKAKAIAKCLDVKPEARFDNLKQFLITSGIK